jgi:hypothetical protein
MFSRRLLLVCLALVLLLSIPANPRVHGEGTNTTFYLPLIVYVRRVSLTVLEASLVPHYTDIP